MQLIRLKPSMKLMLGQTLALGVSFFVPMLLARQLTTEDFGTYRLVMLLQLLLTIVGSVGFDGGLFRHVRSESYAPAFQGSLSLIWGFACGVLVSSLVWLFGPALASLLSAPDLAVYSGHLAILVLFAMPTAHVEHLCIAIDRPGLSASIVSIHALGCAGATVSAMLTVGTLSAIFLALNIWFAARLITVSCVYLLQLRSYHYPLRTWWETAIHHMQLGFPIGGNNLLIAVGRFDRFLVSALFGVAGFARYSVGCLEIPLARQWIETSQNLASVQAVDRSKTMLATANLKLWVKNCARIWIILLPLVVLGEFFATDLLTIIFGAPYSNAANIFRVFLVGLLFSAFDPELFFRATQKASISTVSNLVAMIIFAVSAFGFYRFDYLSLEGLMALRVGIEIINTATKYCIFLWINVKKKPLQTASEGAALISTLT